MAKKKALAIKDPESAKFGFLSDLGNQSLAASALDAGVELLKQPLIQTIAGVVAAQGLEKIGLIDDPWTTIIQGSITAYGISQMLAAANGGTLGSIAALAAAAGLGTSAITGGSVNPLGGANLIERGGAGAIGLALTGNPLIAGAMAALIPDIDLLKKIPGIGGSGFMKSLSDFLPVL